MKTFDHSIDRGRHRAEAAGAKDEH